MTTLLRCVNGHEWRADPGSSAPCPMCGAPERTMATPPTFPEERPALSIGSEMPQTPPVLAGYEVLEEIGRGGMGIVYRARHRDSGQVVALKVIRKEKLSSADMVSRFRREALASSRLQHPNLVQVFEADLAGETPFLAIEFVPGLTLQKLVEDGGPLPVALACDFIRQAALGLEHADRMRLVHRDIKPSNIMVLAPVGLPLPPRPVVKILDMGVARLFQSEHDAPLTTLTRDGSVIGTPDYIAPEQLENPRGVDIRADIYSLGCTLYYLLTGQVPFPGGSLVQKLDRQRWHVAPAVGQLRPDIPSAVAAVVRKLMAKHPDDRFQNAGELASALEALARTGVLPGIAALASLSAEKVLTGHKGGVQALAWAGRLLVSAGSDRSIRVWDASTGQEVRRCGEGKLEVSALAGLPGLVLACHGVTMRVYDLATGKETLRLAGHTDALRCVAASGDGKLAATGGDDRTVRVWDLERGTLLSRNARHGASVAGVAFSPDGRSIASAGRDGTVQVWDANTGRGIRSIAGPKGPITCIAWAADGKGIFTGHFDTTLRLWDALGRESRRFGGHKQMVTGLAVLGRLLTSSSKDQTARLWDVAAGGEAAVCQGHTGPVATVAAGPEGTFATAGTDGTVRLWRTP